MEGYVYGVTLLFPQGIHGVVLIYLCGKVERCPAILGRVPVFEGVTASSCGVVVGAVAGLDGVNAVVAALVVDVKSKRVFVLLDRGLLTCNQREQCA